MKAHAITEVRLGAGDLTIVVDGREHCFPLADVSPRLAAASRQERERFEISPSGYGIHWPLLDEDLSVDGLLGVAHHPSSRKDRRPARAGARPGATP